MMLRRLVNTAVVLTLAVLAAISLRAQPGGTGGQGGLGQGGLVQGLHGDVSIFKKLEQIQIKDPLGPNPPLDVIRRYGVSNVNANEYGSTVFVSSASGCTAVLVGPRVLLTARHCTPGDTIKFGPTKMKAKCTRLRDLEGQPVVDEDHDDDVSLCFTADKVPGPYEVLSFDPNFVSRGKELVLSGYGVTGEASLRVGQRLNLGLATITRSVLDTIPVELETDGRSQVDFGDSGGGAFFVPEGTTRRFVVAVNKKAVHGTKVSFLTPLAGLHIKILVEQWRARSETGNHIQIGICGVAGFSTACRQ